MSDPVDWDDPCARAAALRSAYYDLLAGKREVRIRYRSSDTEDDISFAQASTAALQNELRRAEIACAVKQGKRPGQHAIRAG